MDQSQLYIKIYETKERLSKLTDEYWSLYSGLETWYFWFNIASVLISFIILYLKIDKNRLFEISFFGYTAHILWSNVDSVLSHNNYLIHPHPISSLTPTGITVTAVLFPVTFMLVYQYCTNKEKNFYVYTIIVSLIFGYGFGGLSSFLELLKMHKGMTLTYLVFIDIAVAFLSLWMTRLFLMFKNRHH
ncbi:hypothetical protein SAMN05192559_11240 [Halobacillus karajensis]|uniref:Uncharacterized protein n=1 Tax=Halobacillus karajensis TaxID=195088 RepID=A0A024PA92_9BACI|nr:hypothetical protein [Halobacillus karajensis]CDQ21274.1 hypothetical protein BN982_03640 [Halobacillus karajensis]CDQ25656.1 hypothetical protein BN983_04013 [Halobacillus karajensis]CDQ25927.1 hypothetical protein BN981_00134 [Halobacillus karajensis]SEI10261.1 hypothetical protein SAMN05192559_11240 [Halobacillus karajensis]